MNILFNISHPAHVHFFKNTIRILSQKGHGITTVARNKDITLQLLDAYDIRHFVLTTKGKGIVGLVKELIEQQFKLLKIIKKNKIDIMLQIGGIFNAPVGKLLGIPTLAFSDTEHDKWSNRISFPLSKHVFSPTCFNHTIGGYWKNQIHYPGYHELAYLSPHYTSNEQRNKNIFLVRFVGWGAGHDIGKTGLSRKQKIELINLLSKFGSVHISSESPLPEEFSKFTCRIDPSQIHSFMATCKMIVGESPTMVSEAACLGIPAVLISNFNLGYSSEQDKKYNLIKHFKLNQWHEIIDQITNWACSEINDVWQQKRYNMLESKIDVTAWLVDLIENYPESIIKARKGLFEKYRIKYLI